MVKILIILGLISLLAASCVKQGHLSNGICISDDEKFEDGAVQCVYSRKEAEKLYKEKGWKFETPFIRIK